MLDCNGAVEKLHWLQMFLLFSTVCHFFLPSFAWYVANLQWYAGADGWNGVWIPSDVVMKTPRLADCPAIWGAVSSKGGGVGPVNKSFERPGSHKDEDDPVFIFIFFKRWSWAWICIFLPGWGAIPRRLPFWATITLPTVLFSDWATTLPPHLQPYHPLSQAYTMSSI